MTERAPSDGDRPRRSLWRRLGLLGLVLVVFMGMGAGGALWMQGRPITVPDWLEARIESRLARELPTAQVSFDEMVFVMEEGWRPRVRLRDVRVASAAGQEVLRLNEVKATFAMARLLEGIVQPRDIALSGIFATLRRSESGQVSLRAGTTQSAPAREAASLPELIAQMDAVLQRPAMRALKSIDLRAVTLRYVDARANREWIVDGARMRLARTGDDLALAADLAVLGGGASVATVSANYSSRIGQTAADFGVSFDGVAAEDIAAQGPAFAWLGALRAPISGAVRSGIDTQGQIAPLNATLQIGKGVLQPNAEAAPIPFESARSYFSFDPAQALLRFDTISLDSEWVSGEASGTALLGSRGEAAAFSDLVGQFELTGLRANPQALYAEPVEIARADVDFQLKLDPFRLRLGRLQITDQGRTFGLDGHLEAGPQGWRVALDGRMDAIAPERVLALWPERVKARTRSWLAENLIAGQLENIDVALRLEPDAAPQSYVAFDYADAKVRYARALPPIEEAQGHFSLAGNRLVIAVSEGAVRAPEGGVLDVRGSSFIIPDVSVRGGAPSVVKLRSRSSITAALSVLDLDPLRLMKKAGLGVGLAAGRAEVEGTLAIPLKRGGSTSDITFHASGTLSDVQSDVLVRGRDLRAERLILTADNTRLQLEGAARLDGAAFRGSWTQPIGQGAVASALRGAVTINDRALRSFGIDLPDGMLSGEGQGQIAVDLRRGSAPAFSLTSDLRGLRLAVPQLSWVKDAGRSGELRVAGALGAVPRVEELAISGAGLNARGAVALNPSGGLERLRFERVRLGDWLDVPVDLVGQGTGQPLRIALRGGTLDLRSAAFGGTGNGGGQSGGSAAVPLRVALDRLQITDTIALTDMRGDFTTSGGLDGTFEARLNGGAPVRGRVVPQNGRSAVRLQSDDAGGVLRSAGLLKQVQGGSLSLTLLPVGAGGAFDGRVEARAVRVQNAPGIAGLVNAISVVGLVNELNGDGIYFEDVEGDFRLTPDRLTLTAASAVGASMGLSMDGVYELESNVLDMQGVITPVYLLNGIGSVLTRRGEGLIGFNYTLRGAATAPQVSVNPLSALTPGMFREVFRRPPPELPEVEGAPEPDVPGRSAEDPAPTAQTYEGR